MAWIDKLLKSPNYRNKYQPNMKKPSFLDVATSRSLKSQVDLFSKFEVNFLQKYMKCILTDQFSKLIANIHEEFFYKKLAQKISKTVGCSLFQLRADFTPKELLQGLTDYFREKSLAVSSREFPEPAKLVHSCNGGQTTLLKGGELLFVDVKIRVQVARIEEIPQNIQSLLTKYGQEPLKNSDKKLQQLLLNYRGQYLNILVFYYGDIHFRFNRPQYQIRSMKIGKKEHKVRLFVVYVSKTAMFQTFRTTNKVNVECINDLVISFYDIKREKKLLARQKRKENQGSSRQPSQAGQVQSKPFDLKLLLGAGGAICVGLLLIKMFS